MTWDMSTNEMFTITMPRFTNLDTLNNLEKSTRSFDLIFEPSTMFTGAWHEGIWNNNTSPYNSSHFIFIKNSYFSLDSGEKIKLKIYSENGIKAYCGFPAWDAKYDILSSNPMEAFQLISNSTGSLGTVTTVTLPHPRMGLGCGLHSDCNERGTCDYCTERCSCNPGWGASTDLIMTGDSISKYCYHRLPPFLPLSLILSQVCVPLGNQLLICPHPPPLLMLWQNVLTWESVIVSRESANASLPTPAQPVIDVSSSLLLLLLLLLLSLSVSHSLSCLTSSFHLSPLQLDASTTALVMGSV
jgi:hypothetical protein